MPKQPAYKQIQDYILHAIGSGSLAQGEQIPTEMALAEQFGVSRMTVNRAIVALTQQGKLTRTAGRGTFVSQPKNDLPLMHTVDFAEEVRHRAGRYHATVLAHKSLAVFDDLALRLGLATGEMAGYCEVLHHENDTPMILECRYVNLQHVGDFLAQDFTTVTPTAYLLKRFPLTEIEHTVEAISPSATIAKQLQLDARSPCLKIARRTWSDGVLISYAELTAVGHAYRLRSRYQLTGMA